MSHITFLNGYVEGDVNGVVGDYVDMEVVFDMPVTNFDVTKIIGYSSLAMGTIKQSHISNFSGSGDTYTFRFSTAAFHQEYAGNIFGPDRPYDINLIIPAIDGASGVSKVIPYKRGTRTKITKANNGLITVEFQKYTSTGVERIFIPGFTAELIYVGGGSVANFTDNNDGTFSFLLMQNGNAPCEVTIGYDLAYDDNGFTKSIAGDMKKFFGGGSISFSEIKFKKLDGTYLEKSDWGSFWGSPSELTMEVTFTSSDLQFYAVLTEQSFNLMNLTLSNFTNVDNSGTFYTATVYPGNQSGMGYAVATLQDSSSYVGSSFSFQYQEKLSPGFNAISANLTSANPVQGTVYFTYANIPVPVSGFDLSDLTFSKGNKSNLSFDPATNYYTFDLDFAGQSPGPINASINSGAVSFGSVGIDGFNGQVGTAYQPVIPNINVIGLVGESTSNQTMTIVVEYGQNVMGFSISTPIVTNGTVSNFIDNNGGSFFFDVTATGSGLVTVELPGDGSVQDWNWVPMGGNSYSYTYAPAGVGGGSAISPVSPSVARKTVMSMTLSKSEIASITGVSSNQFRRVLVVYSSAGHPKEVLSFKGSAASPSAKFFANVNSGASYQIQRVIVVKTNHSFVIVQRAAIPSASQYDIQVT